MKLIFTDDRISEYKNGDFYAKNTGEPVEVSPAIADEILAATHRLDGAFVPVFELAGADKPADESTEETEESEPETVESLAKKHNRAELEEMAKEAGLDGNTYTNKTELAAAILAANDQDEA